VIGDEECALWRLAIATPAGSEVAIEKGPVRSLAP